MSSTVGAVVAGVSPAVERKQPDRLPDRLSPAITPTRSHPASVVAAQASIVVARKNFRRLRDTSPQTRSRERLSCNCYSTNHDHGSLITLEDLTLKRSTRKLTALHGRP